MVKVVNNCRITVAQESCGAYTSYGTLKDSKEEILLAFAVETEEEALEKALTFARSPRDYFTKLTRLVVERNLKDLLKFCPEGFNPFASENEVIVKGSKKNRRYFIFPNSTDGYLVLTE